MTSEKRIPNGLPVLIFVGETHSLVDLLNDSIKEKWGNVRSKKLERR